MMRHVDIEIVNVMDGTSMTRSLEVAMVPDDESNMMRDVLTETEPHPCDDLERLVRHIRAERPQASLIVLELNGVTMTEHPSVRDWVAERVREAFGMPANVGGLHDPDDIPCLPIPGEVDSERSSVEDWAAGVERLLREVKDDGTV